MTEYVYIVTKPQCIWIPPKYGKVKISVDQFLSRSNANNIVNFCVDACERVTYCNGNMVPALFSFLCGKKQNLFKYFTTPEYVYINVASPVSFYFTDENNHIITENTPIIRCKIAYDNSM